MFSSCAFVFKLHISTMPTPTDENSGGTNPDSQSPDSQSSDRHGYSESHLEVLRAYEDRWEEGGSLPFTTVAMEGMGPFSRGKIWSYLWDLGAEVSELEDAASPDVLVLGRERVDMNATCRLLRQREGERLRICSQEMLLGWSMTGVDPNKRPQTVDTFIEGHPALESVRSYLDGRWPGTDPIPSSGEGEAGEFGPKESPLVRLGYTVGQDGLGRPSRRDLLHEAYELELDSLPGNYTEEYIEEWGPAESGVRLKRIANHLAANCRNFRGRENDYSLAISHWEEDLRWLEEEFYNPLTYGFTWPEMQ